MSVVFCTDILGALVSVPEANVMFSPAVYGILIENNQVLLQRHAVTGLWQPPGSRVPPGQTPSRALRLHLHAVAGFIPNLGPLISVAQQHWLDVDRRAWHLSILFFALSRPAGSVANLTRGDGRKKAEWLALNGLLREQMQFGYDAVQAGRLHLLDSPT